MKHCLDSFPVPLIHLKETDSTLRYLNMLCEQNNQDTHHIQEFTTVISDFQTAGKGQRGNSWESERGKNLLFCFVFYPDFLEVRKQFLLSQLISVSIKEELETEHADDFSIKWPNDIYWKDKKICGILIENNLIGSKIERSIAGIGININQKKFYSSAPNPVSLIQIMENRREIKILPLLANIIKRCMYYYELFRQGDTDTVSERYRLSLYRRDGFYPYRDKDGAFKARILRVKPEGMLVLADEAGEEREYTFQEVRYLDLPAS
ncbi:Bifunctional ligase/repressor BirA [termite gut metagenome]|uniref:Bifunctional ligase/repressor BirA n=1 Tax=termite gut metagenome TaxID=433724 RepID=A0A5J4RDX9_9ZZZZ